jgi:hypothetical protein
MMVYCVVVGVRVQVLRSCLSWPVSFWLFSSTWRLSSRLARVLRLQRLQSPDLLCASCRSSCLGDGVWGSASYGVIRWFRCVFFEVTGVMPIRVCMYVCAFKRSGSRPDCFAYDGGIALRLVSIEQDAQGYMTSARIGNLGKILGSVVSNDDECKPNRIDVLSQLLWSIAKTLFHTFALATAFSNFLSTPLMCLALPWLILWGIPVCTETWLSGTCALAAWFCATSM